MKTLKYIFVVIVLFTTIAAQPAGEQLPQLMHKSFGAFGMMNFPDPNFQDRGPSQERMEMMITWKLTEDLNLTPEQADKFFPLMRAHREDLDKIDIKIIIATKELRDKVEDRKEISDGDLNKTINQVYELEKQKVEERANFINELDGILDNTQRAKLVTFKNRFTQDLREQIRARPSKRTK